MYILKAKKYTTIFLTNEAVPNKSSLKNILSNQYPPLDSFLSHSLIIFQWLSLWAKLANRGCSSSFYFFRRYNNLPLNLTGNILGCGFLFAWLFFLRPFTFLSQPPLSLHVIWPDCQLSCFFLPPQFFFFF